MYVWCTWQSFFPSYWDLRERKTERTFYRQESNRGNHLFWEGAKGKIIYHDGRQTDIIDSDERDETSRKNAPHWDAGIECSCKRPSASVKGDIRQTSDKHQTSDIRHGKIISAAGVKGEGQGWKASARWCRGCWMFLAPGEMLCCNVGVVCCTITASRTYFIILDRTSVLLSSVISPGGAWQTQNSSK